MGVKPPVTRAHLDRLLATLAIKPAQIPDGIRVSQFIIRDVADVAKFLHATGRKWDGVRIRKPGAFQGMFAIFR